MAVADEIEALQALFRDFDVAVEKLETIPKNALNKTEALLKVFFDGDIFKEPSRFLSAIDNLSEEIGHAYYTVLEVELKRQGLEKPPLVPIPREGKVDKNASQLIVQTQPPKGGGFWDYWGTRAYAKVWERFLKRVEASPDTPQISTSKEVLDILEFGRQLIPEFNRVQEYFQKCLDHLYFFDDPDTRERFKSELRKHMSKLCGIIRAFCRTVAEYRKELVGDRKRDIGKSVIAMKIAEYHSMGQLKTSELYKMLREARGPTEF